MIVLSRMCAILAGVGGPEDRQGDADPTGAAGLPLYRGLGGNVSMPPSFYKTDENFCRGFAEWGFMSTTSDRQVGGEEVHSSMIVLVNYLDPH